MRNIALITTAMLGLAFFSQAHAQSAAAPQPGLPPGAAVGATMAQPPSSTGALKTTTTGAQPTPSAPYAGAATTPPPPRVIHHRRRIRHHRVVKPAPVAPQ